MYDGFINGVFDINGMDNFVAEQKILFLEKFSELFDKLEKETSFNISKLKFNELLISLDKYFCFSSIKNAEIRFCWLFVKYF